MAQDGAHIAQMVNITWINVTNVEFCVGREQALNATKEVEDLVVEIAEKLVFVHIIMFKNILDPN